MQLGVEPRLLLGAFAQLAGHVLAGLMIGGQVGLERRPPGLDRVGGSVERGDHSRHHGSELAGSGDRGVHPPDPALALVSLALAANPHLAFGGQLGAELRAPPRVGTVVRRRPPALDQRRDPALLLAGLVERPHRLAMGGGGPVTQ